MANPGWKTGPEILLRNPYYDDNGWLPCAEFAWGDTMLQFARINNEWQSCYSMGYRVNVQLRQGERLTRNWFNKGLHVNMDGGGDAGSLKAKIGEGSFRHLPRWGDIAPGRVGNGSLVYDVPLANGAFRGGALAAVNLASNSEDHAGPAVHVKDREEPGASSIIRMPSSYVYLDGQPGVHARGRRWRRDQGASLRQQRPGLEASGQGHRRRRADDRPQAAGLPPLRLRLSVSC